MKKSTTIIAYLLTCLIVYGAFVFTTLEANPLSWNVLERGIFTFIIIGVTIRALEHENK